MIFITADKLKILKQELDKLKNLGRKEIAEKLDEAKSFGDLSENAEYHQTREDQGKMESRIREIEYNIKNAEIINKHHSEEVEIGSVVSVLKKGSKEEKIFHITGKEDADIINGKIDIEAPFTQSMVGKKVGDNFNFIKLDGEVDAYTIISME